MIATAAPDAGVEAWGGVTERRPGGSLSGVWSATCRRTSSSRPGRQRNAWLGPSQVGQRPDLAEAQVRSVDDALGAPGRPGRHSALPVRRRCPILAWLASYTELNARLAWSGDRRQRRDFALVGRNLLHDLRTWNTPGGNLAIPRSVFVDLRNGSSRSSRSIAPAQGGGVGESRVWLAAGLALAAS